MREANIHHFYGSTPHKKFLIFLSGKVRHPIVSKKLNCKKSFFVLFLLSGNAFFHSTVSFQPDGNNSALIIYWSCLAWQNKLRKSYGPRGFSQSSAFSPFKLWSNIEQRFRIKWPSGWFALEVFWLIIGLCYSYYHLLMLIVFIEIWNIMKGYIFYHRAIGGHKTPSRGGRGPSSSI